MKLLLDTHALLWRHTNSDRLPAHARTALSAPDNDVLVSIVSAWELAIKYRLGKIELATAPTALVRAAIAASGYQVLGVELAHIEALESLPLHHGDPFDRLLVAQCIVEEAALVTGDSALAAYPIDILWSRAIDPGA